MDAVNSAESRDGGLQRRARLVFHSVQQVVHESLVTNGYVVQLPRVHTWQSQPDIHQHELLLLLIEVRLLPASCLFKTDSNSRRMFMPCECRRRPLRHRDRLSESTMQCNTEQPSSQFSKDRPTAVPGHIPP